MRYRAVVSYDGTAYFGFQRQLQEPTIQGELEKALYRIKGQNITIIGAGRTDSGVHSSGQVIAFDIEWDHPFEALKKALNVNLPEDISVLELAETDVDFHPRFDAKRRTYSYYIYNQRVRNPLVRRISWHIPQPLDIVRLNQAAKAIIGRRDFATFGQAPQGSNTIREVFESYWYQREDLLVYQIEADAYLYRMVRSLVGSMKRVGEGNWTVDGFIGALVAADRKQAAQTAPAHGLFLTKVSYE